MSNFLGVNDIYNANINSKIVINPNFQRIDEKIFFNLGRFHISRRESDELSEGQIQLFDTLHEQPTLDRILCNFPDSDICLKRWWNLGIIELVAPLKRKSDSHLVVIEPHIDDAILSVGGALLNRRGEQKITIVSNIFHSNYTCYHEKTTHEKAFVTERRAKEARLACEMVGATHLHIGQLDKPLRWMEGNGQDLLHSDQLEELATMLRDVIAPLNADEIWIPIASGSHSDHHNTRNAAILMLQRYKEEFVTCRISLYEDLPYGHDFGGEMRDRLVSQINGGSLLDTQFEDITSIMENKKRLVGIFASQFRTSFMVPSIISSAKNIHSDFEFSERRWALTHTPTLPSYVDFEQLDSIDMLFKNLKDNDVVNLVIHDYFVAKDIEKIIDEFSPLKLNIYTREREKIRTVNLNSEHVSLTYYSDTIDAFYKCVDTLLSTENLFCVIAGYQLGQPAVAARFEGFKDPKHSYQTLWMSSMVGALDELIANTLLELPKE
ncbi:PIG-L deacetylase family protein [Photobacterium indicum]|uniref:PIG-L family deacetylase n=1 Tax=Photobacterium indicum TaxID=81447 RepID=A0A2T3L9A5_9GAMM|nr:PIG-L family deacetylase [Photobacterium indicum]PSV47552.1 PIG-L family deacetylase [Photobacterium indicum]